MALFDNLGKKLTQTGQEAVNKTKSVAETVKLNSAISEAERTIGSNYTKIGQAYYDKYACGGWDSEFSDMFAAVSEARTRIDEYEEQLRQLRGVVLCKNCGAELSEGMAFCGRCGDRLPLTKASEPGNNKTENDPPKCANCGAELESEAAFCTTCGEKREQL